MYEQDHPGNRIGAIEDIQELDNVFRLRASHAGAARLVLKSETPLLIVSAQGATAHLRPGWDGTLGYSHYGLELSIAAPGDVVIILRSVPPPNAHEPFTDAELTSFHLSFATRSSRFPDRLPEFSHWQAAWRQNLAGWLMGGPLPQRVPLEPTVTETKVYPAFTLYRVEYHSQHDRTNVALLSLPHGVPKAPLLLALHGHENGWGEASESAYTMGNADDFCAYFAERGWAVLQPATMGHELQYPTWTLQGQWSWDAMTAIDCAATFPAIDMQGVAVCGLSTGAHLAMHLLALDARIKAGVVGCIFGTWHHYRRLRIPPHCDCGVVAQLSPHIEQCDWAALAAPKPVQFQHGRKDASFCPGADPALLDLKWNTAVLPATEYEAAFAEVRRAYRLAGAPDDTDTRFHDGPHCVDSAAAFEWLSKKLISRSDHGRLVGEQK